MSRDVVFKEDRSWDRNIDKIVTGVAKILYDEKDKNDHVDK